MHNCKLKQKIMNKETKPKPRKVLCPVKFQGRKYFGIREFDCHNVGLYTEKTLKGTFFTSIPISPKRHRDVHPTKAKIEIEFKNNWTIFNIFSDWGKLYTIEIHNSLSEEIEIGKRAMIDQGFDIELKDNMSSFRYGKHTQEHLGVWLRYKSNPDVIDLVNKSKQKRFLDRVERVVVSEYDKETNQVWLEIWCVSSIDSIRGKNRHNVFSIKTIINKEWSCEGDLGSGIKF